MQSIVYDLKSFYRRRAGRLVRRLLSAHIHEIWPDVTGMRFLGYGYATPYLRSVQEGMERAIALMPSHTGVHFWPEGGKGLAGLCHEEEWPLETESVDRILMVHSLEHSQNPDALLHEAWRVLKSNGRLLLIVPHRLGLWARADWTPFGHGTPYSTGQVTNFLRNNRFIHERTEKALFMPPFRSFLVLRTAYMFEAFGRYVFPGLAGVHMIEASKQIYSGTLVKNTSRKKGRILMPQAAPAG